MQHLYVRVRPWRAQALALAALAAIFVLAPTQQAWAQG